MGKLGALSSM